MPYKKDASISGDQVERILSPNKKQVSKHYSRKYDKEIDQVIGRAHSDVEAAEE